MKIIFGIFLIVAGIFLYVNGGEKSLTEKSSAAAKRGTAWLLDYGGKFEDPGILWALKNINDKYCKSDALDNFVKTRREEFENHPAYKMYKKLIDKSYLDGIDYDAIEKYGKKYDDFLLPALYCDTEQLKEPIKQGIFDVSSASGYDLTHKLLAIIFMKENGCVSEDEALAATEKISEKIFSNKNSSYYGDLFIEEIALLEYAGLKNKIPPTRIEKIVAEQNNSGSWRNNVLFGKQEDPHTTALAVWALSQYAEKCPL